MELLIEYGGDVAGHGAIEYEVDEVAEFERDGRDDEDLIVHFEDGSCCRYERATIKQGSILANPVYPGPGTR